MPWTIYRYILKELLKLLVASVLVLMLVISFAAAIKPLSDGQLTPILFGKFVFLTAPTMLNFALPFAGAFASTLVFIRLVQDNEITACSASGMSYRTILLPVMGLGLVLTMGLFGLSNFVIPSFFKQAEKTIQQDLITGLVNNLNENRPFVYGNYAVYADSAEEMPLPPFNPESDYQPTKHIELKGIAISEFTRDGVQKNTSTAKEADILIFDDPVTDDSFVQIDLENAVYNDPLTQRLMYTSGVLPMKPILMQNYFRDKPKFLSWPELHQLEQKPERFEDIARRKLDLGKAMAGAKLRGMMMAATEGMGPGQVVRLVDYQLDDAMAYTIQAPAFDEHRGDLVLMGDGMYPVVVTEENPDTGIYVRYETQTAVVKISRNDDDPAYPIVEMTLGDEEDGVQIYSSAEDMQGVTRKLYDNLPRMIWPSPLLDQSVKDMPMTEMMSMVRDGGYLSVPSVAGAYAGVSKGLTKLAHRIKGHLHERAAAAIATSLLLLLGALLSMVFKHQMPLVVYFWSFLLAILSIIIMNSGQNMAGRTEVPLAISLSLLWSGNLVLLIVASVVYCRLARN
ncbi:LptF/LptG family permease [Poriferisphaera sp. WC338]|uniref:LptF/LptG family permease n=1 Tax=Poriferisphaera sp. WC338 TaxID=3425129 RepID=UPI003D81BF8D